MAVEWETEIGMSQNRGVEIQMVLKSATEAVKCPPALCFLRKTLFDLK
jgi:hypothetical protein